MLHALRRRLLTSRADGIEGWAERGVRRLDRRHPLKLDDVRGGRVTPSSHVLTRLLDRHRLTDADYRLSQLRYDLGKLRAPGFVERVGRSRRYRLTTRGPKLGVLLVKLRSVIPTHDGPDDTFATPSG